MAKLQVINQTGEKVKDIKLSDDVFGIEPHNQAVFDAVQVALSNSRQDTAKTKKRDEVSGGGKKPWRQKGTGRARQGSTRSPQWRHGGIVFGPTGEQNHTIKMNRKVRVLALKSVLSEKVLEKKLIVVDKVDFEAPKTKAMVETLKNIGATGKTLFVVDEVNFSDNAILSAFNIPTVGLLYADQINVYDIMNCNYLVCTLDAVKMIEEVLLNGKN
ncbi:MAG: 50S ribosomal protein L4 [Bacilli bacterium]|nr:50S ribosomal protein L4 [Bacilli bacterium]